MMLRSLHAILLAGTCLAATEITGYETRLVTESDGSGRATVKLTLAKAEPGPLSIPLGFSGFEALSLESAPSGTQLRQGPLQGQAKLHAQLPETVSPDCTLVFSFRVPRVFQEVRPQPGEKQTLATGNRLFRHAFVQTQEGTLGTYRFEVLFPQGMMVQAIKEALPKPRRTEVQPRVRLTKFDGRQAAVLALDHLQQGDDTALLLELTPERRSLGWLAVGLALAGLYLFYFRDLVKPNANA